MAILSQLLCIESLYIAGAFIIFLYFWFQSKFTYWTKRGIFGPKPTFVFGNLKDVIKRKEQFFQPYIDNYFKYKHLPYVGMYSFHQPVLSIHDLEVAKHILIKDFDYFPSRGIYAGGVHDPLSANLINFSGSRWKSLRLKLTPTFTPGKLKTMYPIIADVAKKALSYAEKLCAHEQAINFSEFYSKYTMEIIGNVGFGVRCNNFNNPKSEFHVMGHEYFDHSSVYWRTIRAIAFFSPEMFDRLRIRRMSRNIEDFYYGIVKQTVEYRAKHNVKVNDLLQTLIELKNGQVVDENGHVKYVKDFPFTMDDVAANSMLYMIAGYETSATAGQFAAYHLALNPDIQDKARLEVRTVLAKYGGEFTYEAQNEMVYINMVLDETMRMHPSLRALFRRCVQDYRVPNSELVIEKGTMVFVPVHAIQMDPDIFPEPDKFDPERFSPENKAKLHPCHWMPFGEGPKKCIGIRQGYIQAKMALVMLLNQYEIIMDQKTEVLLKIKTSSLIYAVDGDVWLGLRKLEPNISL